MSAPEKSDSHHVRQTSPNSPAPMTSPSRSDVAPKIALMPVPTAPAITRASTSPTRSIAGRRPVSRRRSTAATTTSSVLPTVCPSTVPNGLEKSATSRSPITMPGHRRVPNRTSTAMPTPTGGHSAVTAPSRYARRRPIFAAP